MDAGAKQPHESSPKQNQLLNALPGAESERLVTDLRPEYLSLVTVIAEAGAQGRRDLAARKLQADGIITYKRGQIAVLSRDKLEKCACECYVVVKRDVSRLLSG